MNSPLPSHCGVAFKEWAAVCAALSAGAQTIILRKGGIHEGRAGFRVEHETFWLLPTHFHQSPTELVPEADRWTQQALRDSPPDSSIRLLSLCQVSDVVELSQESQLSTLAGLHIWSEETLAARFHYRRPGLFLLIVRCRTLPQSQELDAWPELAGCKSWALLPRELSTSGAIASLDDSAFAARRHEVLTRLQLDPH